MKYEILSYKGVGYQKLMNFNSWRIAILNYIDELEVNNLSYVEAHLESDEAFVLLKGQAKLIFANVENNIILNFETLDLKPNKVYNIKAGTYHTHILSEDCQLLIVEEENTSYNNSPRIYFDETIKTKMRNLI